MKEERCCCGLLKITTAGIVILCLTVLFGIAHLATPPILNISPTAVIVGKVLMVVGVICAILCLVGIKRASPKLMKPIIICNVLLQAFLLLEIFYSIAAIFFPSLPVPEAVKDVMKNYELRLHSVEDKVESILSSIATIILVINVILYAISLRVLIILVKCFFTVKTKRYQPVPTVFRMPPRPLVVKAGQAPAANSQSQQETAIEMK